MTVDKQGLEEAAKALYEDDDAWSAAFSWPDLAESQTSASRYRELASTAISAYLSALPPVDGLGVGEKNAIWLQGYEKGQEQASSVIAGQNRVLQRKIDLLETTVSFTRRWAIEKDGNGSSAEERLSAIANHPGIKGFSLEDHNG